MRNLVVCDFDGVLFDQKGGFRNLFFNVLENATGINPIESYEIAKAEGFYDLESHIRFLAKAGEVPVESVRLQVLELLKRSQGFLFPDTIEFILNVREKYDFCILSRGNSWFQKMKIVHSGIAHVAHKTFVTEDPKVNVFGEVMNFFGNPRTIFIDDSLSEIFPVKEKYPETAAIWISEEKEARGVDFIASDLKKLKFYGIKGGDPQ